MASSYVIPATLLRRGFTSAIAATSMQKVFPGTGMHAVPKDFDQYLGGKIVRGISQQVRITNGNTIFGSGIVGA